MIPVHFGALFYAIPQIVNIVNIDSIYRSWEECFLQRMEIYC